MPVDAIDWLLAATAAAWVCIAVTLLAWWERRTSRIKNDLDRLVELMTEVMGE